MSESEFDLESNRLWYLTAWRDALAHLVRWEPEVIDQWLVKQAYCLDMESTYHETPIHDVIPQLVPQELWKSLNMDECLKLTSLITLASQSGQHAWPGEQGYDWVLARENINALLAQHGYSLP